MQMNISKFEKNFKQKLPSIEKEIIDEKEMYEKI